MERLVQSTSTIRKKNQTNDSFQEGLISNQNFTQAHTQRPDTSNEDLVPNRSATETINCPVQIKATQTHLTAFLSYFSFDRKSVLRHMELGYL